MLTFDRGDLEMNVFLIDLTRVGPEGEKLSVGKLNLIDWKTSGEHTVKELRESRKTTFPAGKCQLGY